MHAESPTRWSRILTILIPVLALTGCGEGNGPTAITNSPADPLPDLPPGFCDPINFEIFCDLPEIINFNIAGLGTTVIDNPDKSGINESDRVAQMQKGPEATFGGTRLNPVDTPVDFSAGEVFKIKVWSPRPVPVTFKIEETTDGSGGVEKVADHSGSGTWEELCFDFTDQTVTTIGLTLIFDNGRIGRADILPDEWTFFYDDITLVESCVDTGPATGIVPDVKLYDPAGNPDLVIPDDYAEITPFGSQSVINTLYADDDTYNPVLAVSSGVGYGANVAQVGFIGFDAGFVTSYDSLDFKVKDMPNNVLFVKLFDGVDSLRLNLTSSSYAEELDNGWFQVSIPLVVFNGAQLATGIVFESDNTAPMQFTMLLTDIGFGIADTDGGNGGGPFDGGLVTNGDFEAGVNPWLLGTSNPIGAENVIDENGNSVFFVDVTAAGNSFDVNLSQKLAITPGETYTLSFKAKSNVGRAMIAGIGQSGGDFYSATQTVNLTTDWQTFEIQVTATDDASGNDFGEADSRVLFDMGAEIGQVFIDDVSLVVSNGDGNGGGPFDGGLVTNGDFEAGVNPWLLGTSNPIGAENVIDENGNSVFFVDVTAAGNSFDVNLSQKLAITPGETYTLSFKAKSNVARAMIAGIGQSGGDFYSATQTVNLTTDWQTFEIQVTATDDTSGNDFGEADSRVLFDMGAEIGQVFIDDVSLVVSSGGGNGGAGSDLVVDGGFELAGTAGLQPPWFVFENGGTVGVSNANSNGGAYAARLQADATSGSPSFPILKIERVGAGSLTGGESVTVSFDVIDVDNTGVGKTFVAELFTEQADPPGGATNEVLIGGYDLTGLWATRSVTTNLGADATNGVSLLFKADCGSNTACTMDVFIDNVSIVIN